MQVWPFGPHSLIVIFSVLLSYSLLCNTQYLGAFPRPRWWHDILLSYCLTPPRSKNILPAIIIGGVGGNKRLTVMDKHLVHREAQTLSRIVLVKS